jgi:Tfp pilus assembly protein PilV
MIEFLMAAFIMAIGLLGLAALQVASTRQGTTSRQLGTATFIAHNLLDRIQAEGSVTSAERSISTDGNVVLNGRVFQYTNPVSVDVMGAPAAGPSYTFQGLLPNDPYYTVTTSPGFSATAPPVFFSTSYKRNAGTIYPYAKTGIQEFTVNVTWREYDPQNPSSTTNNKFFSVSRYVRM